MGSEDSHEGTIASGAGLVLVATVLSTAIGFLIRTFLIRQLPTADYGLFALSLTIGGVATTVCTLGLRQGVARTVSRCETESDVRDVTLTAVTSALAASLLVSAVLVFRADLLATRVFREQELVPFLQVVGVLVPNLSIQSVAIATFRGKKRVHERIVVSNLVSPVARIAFVTVLVLLGYGAFGAIVAWTAGITLSTALGLFYLYRRTTTFEFGSFSPRYRSLLAFSLPLMISSVMWTTIQHTDNLLLGYFKTSFEVGIYDGAFLLGQLLLIVLGSFGFLFMPIFSELEAAGETKRMHDVYSSVTEWAVLLVLPLYVAMMAAPEAILTGLFRASYALGAVPLMFVASGFFVHVLSGSCGEALVALGRTKLVLLGNVLAGALNLLLNLVLIPEFGITGAAAASAGSYALFNLCYLFWLHRETGIVPFSRSFFTPVGLSAVIAWSVWALGSAVIELGVPLIIALLAVTYLLHVAVVLRTKRVTPGDEQLVSQLEAKLDVDVRRVIDWVR